MADELLPVTGDTVAFVQEWMMSGDHEPDQWHRDFAAAIDARSAGLSTDAEVLRGWIPIAEALPRHRYMGAFKTPISEAWNIVGPGSIRSGVFHDYMGDWPAINMVFHLPPVVAALLPTIDSADGGEDTRQPCIDPHAGVEVEPHLLEPVDDVEVEFEVWEGDELQASSSNERDGRHYHAVYSQDGPVRLVRAETRRTILIAAPDAEAQS